MFNASPAGKAGDRLYERMVPPLAVGAIAWIAVPRTKASRLGYVKALGATSFTVRVSEKVVLPPLLVAVTVKEVDANSTVGVPEMTPVIGSSTKPAGKLGEMLYWVTGPPLTVGEILEMAAPFVKVVPPE